MLLIDLRGGGLEGHDTLRGIDQADMVLLWVLTSLFCIRLSPVFNSDLPRSPPAVGPAIIAALGEEDILKRGSSTVSPNTLL